AATPTSCANAADEKASAPAATPADSAATRKDLVPIDPVMSETLREAERDGEIVVLPCVVVGIHPAVFGLGDQRQAVLQRHRQAAADEEFAVALRLEADDRVGIVIFAEDR